MPFFNSATPFDADVEKATNEMNTVEDWSLILDICEKVSRQPNGAKDCLKSIVKRLNHKVPFVSMQALTLLDACVNNSGRPFHLEICSRDFISECRTLMSQKAHPKVSQRLGLIIKQWAEMKEFRDDPSLNLIPSFYDSLKKEGFDFVDTDAKATASKTAATTQAKKEEDDIMKAIALSLQEDSNKSPRSSGAGSSGAGASSLYPSYPQLAQQQTQSKPVQKEIMKVRALYDFEAAEDNELTFKAGELICVLDDSDPNWWKGSNHRGEGLFPANFVTSDLLVELEPEVPTSKKSVQFNEEVEVQTLPSLPQGEDEIDESKIDEVLALIQNADPTGETQPDSQQMLGLEEQCKAMGPLIDTELEKVDRKHANLVELNKKVMEALQMYHSLMKETPAYGYPGMKTSAGPPGMYSGAAPGMPPQGLPPNPTMGGQPPAQVYGNQPQYMMGQQQPPMVGAMGGGGAPAQAYTQSGNPPQTYAPLSGNPAQTYSQNGAPAQTFPQQTSMSPAAPTPQSYTHSSSQQSFPTQLSTSPLSSYTPMPPAAPQQQAGAPPAAPHSHLPPSHPHQMAPSYSPAPQMSQMYHPPPQQLL